MTQDEAPARPLMQARVDAQLIAYLDARAGRNRRTRGRELEQVLDDLKRQDPEAA